jgi:L-alanine-DL-glutamate epimerase-like enolase superfamily enzyme
MVETFGDPDNPFDPAGKLVVGGPAFTPGFAVAPETAGLGFAINWDCVRAHQVEGPL